MDICTKIISCEGADGTYTLHADCLDIRVVFVTDEIVRVRADFSRRFEEESYLLMTTAWPDRLDALFAGERVRLTPFSPSVTETEGAVRFETGKVTLIAEKDPACIRLLSADGTELFATLPGNSFTKDSNRRVTAYSLMKEDDCFYGFGEKTGLLNKNKAFLRERATDAMGYDAERADTLYKHIPFYIRLDRDTGKAVGVFYHNVSEAVFNMGCEKSNYWPRYTYYQADGGDLDCFLIGGERIARILDNYTLLTGRPALLPKRALGYQGSSMYYAELEQDSDDAILEFVDTVREEGFPIDGFHLSSGYTSQDGKRCVFTWNHTRFKDPQAYFAAMNERHAQNVPNIKPGILLSHPRFEEFNAQNVFVRSSKSDTYAVGRWWGGDGAFWDFTNPGARKAWKQCLTDSLIAVGTNSVWNDNCEYDSLMDKDSTVDFDGKGGTIGALKPVMSSLMCRLSNEAVTEHNPNARPYSVCRSGCAGIQHYAQTWCGDNYTDWRTLKYNIPTITGMGLSGQPNEGADIGGFAGPAPTEELFVRWVQQGIFQPRFSIHSASSDNTVTEPWMFHHSADRIRRAIELRYRLAPYLYSLEYEASRTGAPIMRALVYEFQQDANVYDASFEYMFGRDILAANVLEPGVTERQVYLPAGCSWYDWNDCLRRYEGGTTVTVPVTLDTIPLFIREGAVIAMADNRLTSMEGDAVTQLHLLAAPSAVSSAVIYDDDGVTNEYRDGVYRKTTVTCTGGERVTLDFRGEGSYTDTVESVFIEMIAKEKSPYWVDLNGTRLTHYLNRRKFAQAAEGWYYSQTNRTVEIKYPNPKQDTRLTVSFEMFDLIGM